MAGDKDKKGFSGLLDLASEVSDIYEPIRLEPKEEAIKDSDVKKESREAPQSAGVSIDPGRALPTQDTVTHRDSGESEGRDAYNPFRLMIALLIAIGLFFVVFSIDNNAKSDRVVTSRGTEGNSRRVEDEAGNSLMDFPINTSPDSTALHKDLRQKSIISQNSQGGVVLPDAKGTFTPKKNESKALAESGRTEESMLFSGNKREARLAYVDLGAVVLSDGKRYSITGLSSSDFSHLMSNYDARSIGFEMPLRLIDQERTWWDTSGVYSRKAKLFAKSGYVIILFSKKNVYHHVEYSELSGRDRQYIDAIEFSRPSNDPFREVAPAPYRPFEYYDPGDYIFPANNPFDD